MYLVYGNNNIAEHVIQSKNEAINYNQIKQILKKRDVCAYGRK